jgi:hypothetical protein
MYRREIKAAARASDELLAQINVGGCPELFDAVLQGVITHNCGYELLHLSRDAQRECLRVGPQACRKAATAIRRLRIRSPAKVCPRCGQRMLKYDLPLVAVSAAESSAHG